MEANQPTTDQRWLQGLILSGVSLLVAAFLMPAVAQANTRASGDSVTPRTAPSLSIGQLGLESPSLRSVDEPAVATRAKRPKVWKMSFATALNATGIGAKSVYNNTTPNDFDESESIEGESYWDEYGAGDCKRKSRSKVNCLGGVEAYFDVVDEADQVVGEDTFYCVWEQANWYPRAKKKRLKTSIPDAYCGWESDD